jgi:hypothetical protein
MQEKYDGSVRSTICEIHNGKQENGRIKLCNTHQENNINPLTNHKSTVLAIG